jgi:hypothetical protein
VRHRRTLFLNSVDEGVSALNEMNAKEARRVIGGRGIEGWRWAIELAASESSPSGRRMPKMIFGTSPPGGRWTREERGGK